MNSDMANFPPHQISFYMPWHVRVPHKFFSGSTISCPPKMMRKAVYLKSGCIWNIFFTLKNWCANLKIVWIVWFHRSRKWSNNQCCNLPLSFWLPGGLCSLSTVHTLFHFLTLFHPFSFWLAAWSLCNLFHWNFCFCFVCFAYLGKATVSCEIFLQVHTNFNCLK